MKKKEQQSESKTQAEAGTEPFARDDLREISEQISRDFPLTGDESGVVLVDVDPYRLHAFWSLREESLARSRAEFGAAGGPAHLVLRFRELPDEMPGYPQKTPLAVFDRELSEAQGSIEIRIWGAGKTYEAELGLTAEDGGWMSLACSDRVRLPPAGPSSQPALVNLDVSSMRPVESLAPGGETKSSRAMSRSVETQSAAAEWGAATADVQNPPMAEDPSLRGGGPDRLDPEFPNPFPIEQAPTTERETAEQVQPQIPAAANRYFEAVPGPLPASSRPPLSSYALANAPLDIHAELHIHGHARPDREFLLFGRRVPLEADGGFYVRRVLQSDALLLSLLLREFGNEFESD